VLTHIPRFGEYVYSRSTRGKKLDSQKEVVINGELVVYDGDYAYSHTAGDIHDCISSAYLRLDSGDFPETSRIPMNIVQRVAQGSSIYYKRRAKTQKERDADAAIAAEPVISTEPLKHPRAPVTTKQGYVYCVATKYMPKVVKCGITTAFDEESARVELFSRYSTYWPAPEIVHVAMSTKTRKHEKLIFSKLAQYRLGNSELFECSRDSVVSVITAVVV
jgi:hypothetical protein